MNRVHDFFPSMPQVRTAEHRDASQYVAWVGFGLAVVWLELLVVTAVDPISGLAFIWFAAMTVLAHGLFLGRIESDAVLLFGYYAGATLVLYWAQGFTLPEYHGFSGGFGIGTDDSFYYSLSADWLPSNFPVREGYYLRTHQYSALLQAVTPFPIRHPLNVLFFNVVGLSLLPPFTARVAQQLTSDRSIAKLAYFLMLICPLVLMNGVVLTRDGVTAALFIGSIGLFLERRYARATLLALLLFYLRLASGLQLTLAIGVFAAVLHKSYRNPLRRTAFLVSIGLVLVAAGWVLYPFVLPRVVEGGFLDSGLFRSQIIDVFISLTPDASILTQVGGLPGFLRSPIAVTYFLAAPFLGVDQLVVEGTLIPRAVLNTTFALLSVVYLKYFVQAILSLAVRAEPRMRAAAVAYILLIIVISHVSLIIRHKTMLMPLFYVVVAYGMVRSERWTAPAGNMAGLSLIGVQLVRLIS